MGFSTCAARELVVEIRFGEGGDDSKQFVHELFEAYLRYARNHRLQAELLGSDEGEATVRVSGPDVWERFRHEPGKHVVQRVPATEKRGRRHTSTVTVAVLPLPPEGGKDALPPGEIEVTTQRGHGKGGQHQNKTDSAVRMTHRPTGLQVFINGRDQHWNRRQALRILTARVAERRREAADRERSAIRAAQVDGGSRSNKTRTYNFIDHRVVDHRLGTKTHQIEEVMKGRFDLIL